MKLKHIIIGLSLGVAAIAMGEPNVVMGNATEKYCIKSTEGSGYQKARSCPVMVEGKQYHIIVAGLKDGQACPSSKELVGICTNFPYCPFKEKAAGMEHQYFYNAASKKFEKLQQQRVGWTPCGP